MGLREEALELHQRNTGKITVQPKVQITNGYELSLAYTPGVAEPCKEIHADVDKVYDYTNKGNMVAVVSNGTAVLGLGDIGPEAAMPVMEGKSVLFKTFAGIDAFPICIRAREVEEVVQAVKMLEPTFGGINLEDIAAPNCFEIERRLKEECNIPIFHDDQHGTAVVTLAAMLNSVKLVGKKIDEVKVVINGAGAAGIAVLKLLLKSGVKDAILCDRLGAIYAGRPEGMNKEKEEISQFTNKQKVKGSLAEVLVGADVFIGLSTGNVLNQDMVKSMAKAPIIMAMANPIPEILPDIAKAAGARVVCTGRSDFPNQVNNSLAFPGIFRGALDVRAKDINEEMKLAAAHAIAGLVSDKELCEEFVMPDPFDKRIAPKVAAAVAQAAMDSGVARIKVDPSDIEEKTFAIAAIK
ncbi:NAD(P)-dependent malic enzyme [Zhaonella formicivorans]|uniref:NAD(P)-dependent malic enzyme n=1 Tax=Zhaonella formicivorans TaxID=2528593 RepID=UPI0010EC742E|nr:malic enzyme-like NAD(P)-binding protein [Zhaonella formicivorans]